MTKDKRRIESDDRSNHPLTLSPPHPVIFPLHLVIRIQPDKLYVFQNVLPRRD